jgi:hypothetical protein
MPVRAELLAKPHTDQIFQAIAKAGLNLYECDLENETVWARLTHKPSGSYFVIHRDPTWRFLGHYAVSDGPERQFDLSWMSVTALLAKWLSDVSAVATRSDREGPQTAPTFSRRINAKT